MRVVMCIHRRRSSVGTQGRSKRKEPPRVVPVDFCLAPFAPTFFHFVPLPSTLYHFVPQGEKTTQKSYARRDSRSVSPDGQGFLPDYP